MTNLENEINSKSSEILSNAYASNWSEESACVFAMATEMSPNEFAKSPIGMKEVFAALADASKKGHALSGHVLTEHLPVQQTIL